MNISEVTEIIQTFEFTKEEADLIASGKSCEHMAISSCGKTVRFVFKYVEPVVVEEPLVI